MTGQLQRQQPHKPLRKAGLPEGERAAWPGSYSDRPLCRWARGQPQAPVPSTGTSSRRLPATGPDLLGTSWDSGASPDPGPLVPACRPTQGPWTAHTSAPF